MPRRNIAQGVLNVTNSAELLSYIINVTPELREEIPLPKQGESINGIGKFPLHKSSIFSSFLLILAYSASSIESIENLKKSSS